MTEEAPSTSTNRRQSTPNPPPSLTRRDGNALNHIHPEQMNNIFLNNQLQLPCFWPHSTRAYFAQVDAMFDNAQVFNQQQRYGLLLTALNPDHIASLHGELPSAICTHPYDELKITLLRRYTTSSHDSMRKMLTQVSLGNQKPSVFLAQLREVLGVTAETMTPEMENVIRPLSMSHLPQKVREIVSAHVMEDDTAQLARRADEILAASETPMSLTSSLNQTNAAQTDKSNMESQVQQLQQMFKRLSSESGVFSK